MTLPTAYADINHGKIALKTQFAHSEMAATIPGARFVGKGEDYWTVPLTWTSMVCLGTTFGDCVEYTDRLLEWANYEWERIDACLKLRTGEGEAFVDDDLLERINELCPPNRSITTPVKRRYQAAAALLLGTAKRFILLDEQGTGKMTETALALSLYPDTLPALIVAPANTLYAWEYELSVFGIPSVILDGTAVQRRKAIEKLEEGDVQVAICSYNIVSKHSRVSGYGNIKLSTEHKTPKELNEIPWKTVCIDEAHRCKNPEAVQTRAVWAVSDKAEYRWALTGTPVESSPLEFWALLHFIDPVGWPSKVKMQDRWVHYTTNWFGGIDIHGIREDAVDEWRRVTEYLWRRKLVQGLPPLEQQVRHCTLTGKHAKAYKDMAKQLMAETGEDSTILFAQNHMVKAGRLIQLANSYIEVDVTINDDGEEVVEVTPIEPSPKLDLLMDTLEDFEGTPLIVWFNSVKFMRLAQARFDNKNIEYVVIDGSVSAKNRAVAVKAFQEGEVDIILLSAAAASEGITLTRAPIAIVVDRNHSLIINDQKDRRHNRIGSEIHDKITIIDLITKDTLEEDQANKLVEKRKIRDEIISPFAAS